MVEQSILTYNTTLYTTWLNGNLNPKKFDTQENVADALTKPVNIAKFKWCTKSMGLNTLDFC